MKTIEFTNYKNGLPYYNQRNHLKNITKGENEKVFIPYGMNKNKEEYVFFEDILPF